MDLGSLIQCNFGIGIFYFRYAWRRAIWLSTGNFTSVMGPWLPLYNVYEKQTTDFTLHAFIVTHMVRLECIEHIYINNSLCYL